jgi:hypothetical protein
MLEDPALELLQLGARLEAELLVQRPSGPPIGVERICLASASIEGKHELAVEPLAQGMYREELLELWHELGIAALGKVGVKLVFVRRHPRLVEQRGCALRKQLAAHVREWLAAPQRKRLSQLLRIAGLPASFPELLEPIEIALSWMDAQPVARSICHQPVVPKCLA